MRTAYTQYRLDFYHYHAGNARGMLAEMEVSDATEAARRYPLLKTEGIARRLVGSNGSVHRSIRYNAWSGMTSVAFALRSVVKGLANI